MTSLRRSSRQKSITTFFTPHSDSVYTPSSPNTTIELTGADSVESEVHVEKPKAVKRKITSPKVDVENDESCNPSDHSQKDLDLLPKKKKLNTTDQENHPSSTNVDAGIKKTGKNPAKQQKAPAAKKTPNKKKTPQGPKKRRTKFETVSDKLKALGVMPSEREGNCVRTAIYRGFIKITGDESDLDQIVYSGKLPECGHNGSATLRDLLEQPDYAGCDYEDGLQNAVVFCDESEESKGGNCDTGRTYVTQICSGKPEFDSGKFHNHCNECKNFGKCIGDYREAHCDMCGKHYFAGNSGFKCPCMERRGFGGRGGMYDDDSNSGSDNGRDDCSIM